MGCGLHAGDADFRGELAELFENTAAEDRADAFPGMPAGGTLADDLGERAGRMECFSCHNSWTVNCYGCHTVRDDRTTAVSQMTGERETGGVQTYGMSVVSDGLSLGFNSRGRVSPMVGTAIFFTHIDSEGEVLVDAAPLATVDGFSGDGNQHNPVHHHTVRQQPRDCQGCHPMADGSGDHETLARAVGFGTAEFIFVDGEGREHMMDRTVAIDFDGDGEWDDPMTTTMGTTAVNAAPLAASTHLPLDEEAAELGPGPLDLDTINRLLSNPVVPQRPEELE